MTLQREDLGSVIAEVDRRLRTLEATSPLTHASIQDGALKILDPVLSVRVVIGKQADGTYGIWFYDSDGESVIFKFNQAGATMFDADGDDRVSVGDLGDGHYGIVVRDGGGAFERFRCDERGMLYPYLHAAFRPRDSTAEAAYTNVTSATFVPVYTAQFGQVTHQGLQAFVTATTPVGTTGEIRLSITGGATTSPIVIPSGEPGAIQEFRWLHGVALNVGPVSITVEARRTAGAGAVTVWNPPDAIMRTPQACDADGIP